MRTLIRQTVTGSEYWDNDLKKTVFVPIDQEPDFEITDNPKTMIANSKDKQLVGKVFVGDGMIFKTGENVTLNKNQNLTDDEVEENNHAGIIDDEKNSSDNTNQENDVDDEDSKQGYINDDGELVEYQSMTFKDLKKYANESDIAVPSSIKTKAQIIDLIVAAEDDE